MKTKIKILPLLMAIIMVMGLLPASIAFAAVGGMVKKTLNNAGSVGSYTSVAVDKNDQLHISYYDESNSNLKYAYKNENVWYIELVDSVGTVGVDTSIVLNSNEQPCISYYDVTNGALKYAYKNETGWHIETVETGSVGRNTSIALDSNGNPCISYREVNTYNLKYAYKDGNVWKVDAVDRGKMKGNPYGTSLAIDKNGNPCISYYDGINSDLKYAYKDETGWHTEVVDGSGYKGYFSSIAIGSNGNPCISYSDYSTGNLKYAYKDKGLWHSEVADVSNYAKYTSLCIDSDGKPHISYQEGDPSYDLKYTYKDESGWHAATIDSAGNVGKYTSLDIASNGTLCISYYDESNSNLKYAILHPNIIVDKSMHVGTIKKNETKNVDVTITNNGLVDLKINSILSSSPNFTIHEVISGNTIEPNKSKTFIIGFSALEAGKYNGKVEIQSNAPDGVATIELSGEVSAFESNADLKTLAINQGNLDKVFDSNKKVYKVGNANDITSLEITAETINPNATIKISEQSALTGSAIKTVNLHHGANLIPIVVTAPDGKNQKAYVLSVNGTVSNADLNSLTVSEGNISFDKGIIEYDVYVDNDVESIEVSAVPFDEKALILIEGSITTSSAIDLEIGENTIDIMTIAQNASTKTYSVKVNRGTGDVNLSDLSISEGTLSKVSDTKYKATVSHTVENIIVTPTLKDNQSSVTVNGKVVSESVNLEVGENTINIVVTGKDGISQKNYQIIVTRKEELTINNESLPIGIVGANYHTILSAEGGTTPYTWTATGLPPELKLSKSTGKITGILVNEGDYPVEVKVVDDNGNEVTKNLTLKVNLGCGNGAYIIQPEDDASYTGGYTEDGIPMITVNEGISGFKYFSVTVEPVTGHSGHEICLFVHMRKGQQIGIVAIDADFDTINRAKAAFNVQAEDVIKAYIVDNLTNDLGVNPTIL